MIFKAATEDRNKFVSIPETGMGYQVIEAKRKYGNNNKDTFIIYNSELIVEYDQKFEEFRRQIMVEGYSTIFHETDYLLFDTSTISLVPRHKIFEYRTLSESKKRNKYRQSGGRSALDNPKEKANGEEVFVRVSAYENDRRIDLENRKLRPGSYTTTHEDYLNCVKSNDDPIDRYALPNDEEIKWAFYIQPKKDDILQRGIVQPAFGYDGGGIEAYFEKGTSYNTFFDKRSYGK